MTKVDENLFPKVIYVEGAAPATPSAGTVIQYAKADGLLYSKDDAGTETLVSGGAGGGGGALAGARYKRNAGDYTTGSASFVDVDATNMALTITTGARRVQVGLVAQLFHSSTTSGAFQLLVDGVAEGGATDGIMQFTAESSRYMNASFVYLTDVLSAASHTFKLQWKISAGTLTMNANNSEMLFWVAETAIVA